MESKGQIFGLLIIIGLLFLSTYSCVFPVKANPLTTVTLSLQAEPPTVDVSPGSSGIVKMDGEVTCTKYGPDSVKVHLTAESELGGASAEPVTFVFEGISGSEETQPFKVSTRVPMGTTSSLTPILTVQGYFDQGGLRTAIPQVSQIIIILQYYNIEYFIEDREVSVKSEENVKIKFIVVNVGNGEDIFQIDFKNREDLQNKGFKLPAPLEVQMEEDANRSISLEISAPEGNSGTHVADISILSRGSLGSDFSEEVIMSIHLVVTSNLGGQIGSIITSPLTIVIITIVIVVAVFLKIRKREKVSSTSD
ncbi:MAG: choice-of-anchor T family protein [Thermoplasmata archaeon]